MPASSQRARLIAAAIDVGFLALSFALGVMSVGPEVIVPIIAGHSAAWAITRSKALAAIPREQDAKRAQAVIVALALIAALDGLAYGLGRMVGG